MSNDTTVTIVGNLGSDPELRFVANGTAVCNFLVLSTPRSFDKATSEWKDAETLAMRCSIWREAAENVAESLTRGTRVVVTGRLVSRSWDTPEGEKRTVMEMQAEEVGPSLKYATAVVTKAQRSPGGQRPVNVSAANDPWSNKAQLNPNQGQRGDGDNQAATGSGWGGAGNEPPFLVMP